MSTAPREFTSTLSFSITVPPARNACSKSSSVRETRRLSFMSFDATGWSPFRNEEEGFVGGRDCWVPATFLKKDASLQTSGGEWRGNGGRRIVRRREGDE